MVKLMTIVDGSCVHYAYDRRSRYLAKIQISFLNCVFSVPSVGFEPTLSGF
jgi:hypothetical protein